MKEKKVLDDISSDSRKLSLFMGIFVVILALILFALIYSYEPEPISYAYPQIDYQDIVFGLQVDNVPRVYLEKDLLEDEDGIITDTVGDVSIQIERTEDYLLVVTRLDTGEELELERSYWYSWHNSYPQSTVYGVEPVL